MKVLALTGGHERSGFDCGVEALNLWLQQAALQHQVKGISKTFVAVPASAESCEAYRSAGFAGLFVDAKDKGAARFYAQYGFVACGEQALELHLPMW
jgi:hypothetical protein